MSKINNYWAKYDILWSNCFLFVFIEYNFGSIDTEIKFPPPSYTNLHAFSDLVARQRRKKPKIDHISWYIWDRVIILGSIPPFSTMANMIMTSELGFEDYTAWKLLIHYFHDLTIDVFWAIKESKIEIFGISCIKINILYQSSWYLV